METVEEIEAAIGRLSEKEFRRLTDRLLERREADWDARIAEDAGAGRLDSLWAEAEKEIDAGKTTRLDAFVDHEDLSR